MEVSASNMDFDQIDCDLHVASIRNVEDIRRHKMDF